MFESVNTLRSRLDPEGQLVVFHGAYKWTASFKWFNPAPINDIRHAENELNNVLPKDYVEFLNSISNGAVLFYGVHGQWGFKIYNASEIIEEQTFWRKSLSGKWKSNLIAFAELYGEANVLVFDLNRPSRDRESYAVLEANAIDPYDLWPVASITFHDWVDHLITAQGDKYWEWR